MKCILRGNLEEVRRQLDRGLPPNAVKGNLPFTLWAIKYGKLDILKLLLQNGADVNKKEDGKGGTALFYAVQKNYAEAVKLLLDQDDILVDQKDNDGNTPLKKACYDGHRNIAVLLLNKGADVNAKNNEDFSPLWDSVKENHPDIVKLLLDQDDIQVDPKTNQGMTPLHMACTGGYLDIAMLLLKKGADVNAQDNRGISPLFFAVAKDHPDVVKLLLEQKGILVDLQEMSYGYAPLHQAAEGGNIVMIKLLVEQGNAGTSLKNKAGETPLKVAKASKKDKAANLLRSLSLKKDSAAYASIGKTSEQGS